VYGRRQRARRAELSQHFLRSAQVARRLVSLIGLSPGELVVEAGPGRGALTRALVDTGCRIIGVEIDQELANLLRLEFAGQPRVDIVADDFLRFPLPRSPYKFIANAPFSRTTDIVRKLVVGDRPPTEAWIIVQQEAAARFAGLPYGLETLFSLSLKPRWHLEVVGWLSPVNFDPPPRVDSVFLRMMRLPSPLLSAGEYEEFVKLTGRVFAYGKTSLTKSLGSVLTGPQTRRLARDLGLAPATRPSEVSFQQWLGIYRLQKWLNG